METQQKPRVSYAQFAASQQKTVAWVIDTFINDMESPAVDKKVGSSQGYILRAVQRDPIGAKIAAGLRKADIIDLVKRLRSRQGRNGKPVCAATANQYVTFFSGALKYVGSAIDGCEDITVAPIEAARPMLVKLRLIGKSVPRTRVPSDDELDLIFAAAEERDNRKRWPSKIKLLPVTLFAL